MLPGLAPFTPMPAAALNAQLRTHSADAALVVLNLPRPPRHVDKCARYMQVCCALGATVAHGGDCLLNIV